MHVSVCEKPDLSLPMHADENGPGGAEPERSVGSGTRGDSPASRGSSAAGERRERMCYIGSRPPGPTTGVAL